MATRRTKPRIKTSHRVGDRPGERSGGPSPSGPSREVTSERRPSTRKAGERTDGPSVASAQARALAIEIAVAALEKKALGLEILDVAGKVDYTDFLVLMTGRSDRHVAALAQGIEEAIRAKKNKRPVAVEGMPQARWVLMDFGDVVVHVFQEEVRSLYDLEGLWMDAHRLPVPAGVEAGD
jgi:ribosome-associated protein